MKKPKKMTMVPTTLVDFPLHKVCESVMLRAFILKRYLNDVDGCASYNIVKSKDVQVAPLALTLKEQLKIANKVHIECATTVIFYNNNLLLAPSLTIVLLLFNGHARKCENP